MKSLRLTLLLFSLTLTILLHSQQKSSDIPLIEYLSKISNTHQIHFAFPTQLVKDIKVKAPIDHKNWEEELQRVLDQENIEINKINSTHILLRKSIEPSESNKLTISTTIVDDITKEAIGFANVYLSDFSESTLSNEKGKFYLEIPSKKNHLKVIISLLGYKERTISIKELQMQDKIYLEQKNEELSEIIITSITPFSELIDKNGNIHISNELSNINKGAASNGSDINSTLLLLPGISAYQDDDAGIKIRGGNADETLIILDEIPLYNATHYYGFFNAVNADYIHQYHLYKNNLPTEHQGGLSGLLKLKASNRIPDTSSLILHGNSFMASGYGEIKLGQSSSLLLSGRSTYGDINVGRSINNTNTMIEKFQRQNTQFNSIIPDFRFNDIHGKLFKRWNNKLHTDLNFYHSYDNIYASTFINIKRIIIRNDVKKDTLDENKDNIGFSLNTNYFLNSNTSIRLSLHHTDYSWNKINKSSVENFSIQPQTLFTHENSLQESLKDSGIKMYVDNNKKWLSKIGVEFSKFRSAFSHTTNVNQVFSNLLEGRLLNVFAEFKSRFGKLEISPAVRMSSFFVDDKSKMYISPQFNLSLPISKQNSFKASTGINNQFVREINFEDPFGQQLYITSLANLNLIPVARSWNSMIGFIQSKNKLFFDLEIWYKYTNGAVSLIPIEPPIREWDINMGTQNPSPPILYNLIIGKRKSYGSDFMIGFKDKFYTGWIAYTLSKSQEQYKELYDNAWFSSTNDRRHQLKLANNFQMKKFNFTTNYIFTSGRPYLAYEMVDTKLRGDKNNRDQIRFLPEYHRVDVGLTYSFSMLKKETLLGFSVFNLFNHENLNFIQYNYKIPRENGGGPNPVGGNNLTLGTTYGLVNRLVSFDFKIRI